MHRLPEQITWIITFTLQTGSEGLDDAQNLNIYCQPSVDCGTSVKMTGSPRISPAVIAKKQLLHSKDVPEDENMSIASEKWHDDWLRDADSVEDSCRVALTHSDVGVVVQSVVCSHQQTPHPYRFAGTAQRWLVKFTKLFSCECHRQFEHPGGSSPCKERKHC